MVLGPAETAQSLQAMIQKEMEEGGRLNQLNTSSITPRSRNATTLEDVVALPLQNISLTFCWQEEEGPPSLPSHRRWEGACGAEAPPRPPALRRGSASAA